MRLSVRVRGEAEDMVTVRVRVGLSADTLLTVRHHVPVCVMCGWIAPAKHVAVRVRVGCTC